MIIQIIMNRMQIELCLVNRTDSVINANRFSSSESNQMRIDFSNQINSESNANRVFLCESNATRVFFLWFEPTLHQMTIQINMVIIQIKPNPNQMEFFFFFFGESIANQMQIELCLVNRNNSELNANRFSSCVSNQMRIDFSNQINSDSNANRVFFCKSNATRVFFFLHTN